MQSKLISQYLLANNIIYKVLDKKKPVRKTETIFIIATNYNKTTMV